MGDAWYFFGWTWRIGNVAVLYGFTKFTPANLYMINRSPSIVHTTTISQITNPTLKSIPLHSPQSDPSTPIFSINPHRYTS